MPTPIKISALTTGAVNTLGDLIVIVQGGVTYKIPVSFLQLLQQLTLNRNVTPLAGIPTPLGLGSPSLRDVAADGAFPFVVFQSFGAGTGPILSMCNALGTGAAPLATASGNILARIIGYGWDGTGFKPGAQFGTIVATEAWTPTAHGSRQIFTGILTGTTTQWSHTMSGFGNLQLNGQSDTGAVPGTGHLFANAVLQNGIFGGLWCQDGVTAQTIPNGATYAQLTCFNTAQGGNTDASFITPSAALSKVTPLILGRYRVTWDLSMNAATNAVTFNANVFLNGVEQNIEAGSKNQNSADEVGFGATGYVNVTSLAGTAADLDLRLHHDHGSAVDVTPIFCHLNVERVGN